MSEQPNSSARGLSIELDDYEIANLRQGLLFLREIGGDTGDWMGQILLKLPAIDYQPNKSMWDQKHALAAIVGWRLLWPS